MAKKKTKKKIVKKKLTPQEKQAKKEDRAKARLVKKFKTDIRTILTGCGFNHISSRKTDLVIGDRTGEFDGIYIYDNIIVLVEDTAGKRKPKEHLLKKIVFANHAMEDTSTLIEVLCQYFDELRNAIETNVYESDEYVVKHLYCSMHDVSVVYQDRYADDKNMFLSNMQIKYFLDLVKIIRFSARFEFFKFLGIELKDIGDPSKAEAITKYSGTVLAEKPNGFPAGYKVVSFFVDPKMLLERSYVLRADGWRDEDCLYQRLLVKSKIKDIRKFLVNNRRTFVNNIIATLPHDCKIKKVNVDGGRPKTEPVQITIPQRFNIIGIIDGQHRIFAYHESNEGIEREISKLRQKQHLLVTGIIYPATTSMEEKRQFEAKLFLEINGKQKSVPGRLKQDIEVIVKPNSGIAIAKSIISELARKGPLAGLLEVHHYDSGKIKTTSIVSYGLRHIVAIGGESSFYKIWNGKNKSDIKEDENVRRNYVNYCTDHLIYYISGFKESIPGDMWTVDSKKSKVLTPTTINGLIYCMRKLIHEQKTKKTQEEYRDLFRPLNIDFDPEYFPYISSHWKALGEEIYEQCFE